MPKFDGFIGGSYVSPSVAQDSQVAMNVYPETDESGDGKNAAAMYQRPGLSLFTTLATGPVRQLWTGGDPVGTGPERLFAVGGSKLVEVFADTSKTVRGDVGDDATHTPAYLFPNGNQLGVVSAGKYYCDSGSGPVQPAIGTVSGVLRIAGTLANYVSGPNFTADMVGQGITLNGTPGATVLTFSSDHLLVLAGSIPADGTYNWLIPGAVMTASSGCFADGYFVVSRPDSKVFNISSEEDGSTWNGLDAGAKEGYPDNIAAITWNNRELWNLGTETVEVWEDSGAASFPFTRLDSVFIQQGLRAKYSLARLRTGLAWIGADGVRGGPIAYVTRGYVPLRVSTSAVEKAWAGYAVWSDARAYSYEWNSHDFWKIDFPTANVTWVYDATTGLWHQESYGPNGARHLGSCHAFCFGKHLVGDYNSGNIYQMSDSVYQDNGQAITRYRTAPHLSNENLWTFYDRFTLDMEAGLGANPPITLEWSNDGGKNWQPAVTATAGILNATTARVVWRRLGKSRDRVFRVTQNDNSRSAWIAAYLETIPGRH